MKRLLLCVLAVLVVSGSARAAPMCTYTSDVVGSTCEIGGLTFSNFQVIAAGGVITPVISLVSADVSMGFVNLSFNPNLSAPPSDGPMDLHFLFEVTGGVNQVDLGVGGQNATIGERVCSAAIPTSGPMANLCPEGSWLTEVVAYSFPPGPNYVVSSEFAMTDHIWVYKDIGVLPNQPSANGGYLSSFTQSFHAVPEPVTMVLLGSGLLGLGLLRRKTKV